MGGAAGGAAVADRPGALQPGRRGPEWDLLPWCRERDVAVMAYSPLEQGRLLAQPRRWPRSPRQRGATPAQVALAWLLRQDGVDRDPEGRTRASMCARTAAALDVVLTPDDLAALDRAFPPPKGKTALGML